MLCLNKEELLNNVDLSELKQYMLYDIKTSNRTSKNLTYIESTNANESINESATDERKISNKFNNNRKQSVVVNLGVPRSHVQINYTKKLSKYNEPFKINNHKNFADKLFWVFYKIINNLSDVDLEHINSFKVMKEFKINSVEKLQNQKNILKNFKIQKGLVEDDLTNNEKINFKTFHALCVLYLVNVIVVRDNNTYCVLCTNNDEKVINLQNYKLLKISNVKMSPGFNNFDIELVNNITEEELQKILNSYYVIEDISKPLKAFSNYKLDDLVNIAEKLSINIYDEHTKKKKKQELYENIMQKLI
uniref:Uncharacterized protein n=1 Tax=viral metagenome TaxID=1070528 RepID=A0A6C0H5G1_9ZZZZ